MHTSKKKIDKLLQDIQEEKKKIKENIKIRYSKYHEPRDHESNKEDIINIHVPFPLSSKLVSVSPLPSNLPFPVLAPPLPIFDTFSFST